MTAWQGPAIRLLSLAWRCIAFCCRPCAPLHVGAAARNGDPLGTQGKRCGATQALDLSGRADSASAAKRMLRTERRAAQKKGGEREREEKKEGERERTCLQGSTALIPRMHIVPHSSLHCHPFPFGRPGQAGSPDAANPGPAPPRSPPGTPPRSSPAFARALRRGKSQKEPPQGYIIHLNVALQMVVSLYFGRKSHVSHGKHVCVKEPCCTEKRSGRMQNEYQVQPNQK